MMENSLLNSPKNQKELHENFFFFYKKIKESLRQADINESNRVDKSEKNKNCYYEGKRNLNNSFEKKVNLFENFSKQNKFASMINIPKEVDRIDT
jgi:hypothetical protein